MYVKCTKKGGVHDPDPLLVAGGQLNKSASNLRDWRDIPTCIKHQKYARLAEKLRRAEAGKTHTTEIDRCRRYNLLVLPKDENKPLCYFYDAHSSSQRTLTRLPTTNARCTIPSAPRKKTHFLISGEDIFLATVLKQQTRRRQGEEAWEALQKLQIQLQSQRTTLRNVRVPPSD